MLVNLLPKAFYRYDGAELSAPRSSMPEGCCDLDDASSTQSEFRTAQEDLGYIGIIAFQVYASST